MLSDIEIATQAEMLDIRRVAEKVGLGEDDIEMYGKYMAKVSDDYLNSIEDKPYGKLILVTAINPTPAGEGKTTVTIGLSDALRRLGKNSAVAMREPSLGPCFGIKGGAAGGGYAQAVPMDKLNLHFTGDFHAITTANNLLAAVLDNHLMQGNALGIDPNRIVLKRCLDMNDRALRNIVIGLGKRTDGVVREDHFCITVATEIMAILCLAENLEDLRERLSRMLVAYTYDNTPIYARDLGCIGAMMALLKDAIRPNLIQSLEGSPVFVHGGPFANIAHGCNSVRATKTALRCCDYVVTEAGFGADLGAEKFMDIKCRLSGLRPDAVVLVATVRALKYNGGVAKDNLSDENLEALQTGIVNLGRHIDNLKRYGVPVIVTANRFVSDTEAELSYLREFVESKGCSFTVSEVWGKGGEGGIPLAEKLLETLDRDESDFRFLYGDELSPKEKIEAIARDIYGAGSVSYTTEAANALKKAEELGYGKLPVCMAKTQYSLSDNPKLLGAPEGFDFSVREVYVSAGAGFIVAVSGQIMTMPGLPKVPAAERIDVGVDGNITGLF